ncbi:MAG: rhodanese-like domain-containing protein [Pirellulales bacterium]
MLPLEITCRDLHAKLAAGHDLVIVDCREPDEHAIVAIEGAVLLPLGELPDRVAELAAHRNRLVVVHCHLGVRSLRAARWLREQGFAQAQSLAGGIEQWAVEIEAGMKRY